MTHASPAMSSIARAIARWAKASNLANPSALPAAATPSRAMQTSTGRESILLPASIRSLREPGRLQKILVRSLVAFLFFATDPSGVTTQKARYIDQSVAWISGNLAPHVPSEDIAVVLIGEDDLSSDAFRTDWPLDFGKIANIVHALSCAHVAGMFFDFTVGARFNLADGEAALRKAVFQPQAGLICDDDQAPSPAQVFFGRIEGLASNFNNDLTAAGRTFTLAAGGEDQLYPAGHDTFPDRPLRIAERTPAFAIRAAACQGETRMAKICHAQRDLAMNPLRLLWTPMLSGAQALVSRSVQSGEECRGLLDFADFARLLADTGSSQRVEPCPPLLTLTVKDLFRDSAFIARYGNPAATLKDRFVFVGTNLAGLNDAVNSPVHGTLPGVYKHAVALDNLLTLRWPYPTVPPRMILLALALVVVVAIEGVREVARETRARPRSLAAVLAAIAAVVIAILLLFNWPFSIFVALFGYYVSSDLLVRVVKPAPVEPSIGGAS